MQLLTQNCFIKKKNIKKRIRISKGLNTGVNPCNPADIVLFKVNNENTRPLCDYSSKLAIKALERRQSRPSRVVTVNLNRFHTLIWCFHWSLWTVIKTWHLSKQHPPLVRKVVEGIMNPLFKFSIVSQFTFQPPLKSEQNFMKIQSRGKKLVEKIMFLSNF